MRKIRLVPDAGEGVGKHFTDVPAGEDDGGPVIKSNANQRYTTNAETAARFMGLCEKGGVPCQQYAHRTDLGCGSTIGPILAARLGIPSVDVGSPMWAIFSPSALQFDQKTKRYEHNHCR